MGGRHSQGLGAKEAEMSSQQGVMIKGASGNSCSEPRMDWKDSDGARDCVCQTP